MTVWSILAVRIGVGYHLGVLAHTDPAKVHLVDIDLATQVTEVDNTNQIPGAGKPTWKRAGSYGYQTT